MKSIKVLAVVAGFAGLTWLPALFAAQPTPFGAGAQGRPADYLQNCKVPLPGPAQAGGGGGARPAGAPPPPPASYDAREYTVSGIPGVIAAGARWAPVWNGDGNNADGLVATDDGGLYFVQNDANRIGKFDPEGNVTFPFTDLNVSGSMAMNSKGALFVLNRGYTGLSGTARGFASIEQLAPQKRQ